MWAVGMEKLKRTSMKKTTVIENLCNILIPRQFYNLLETHS
jgi:hypothetical protein